MSIMDKVGALLPWRGQRRNLPPTPDEGQALLDDVDRWLQRLVAEPQGLPMPAPFGGGPSVDVRESDDEVVVTVEVPGFARDDLDLVVTPDGLTIRGETREEKADTRDDYRVVRVPLRALRPHRAAAARTRPRPGGGPRQGRRADRQVPQGGRAPRYASRPDQAMTTLREDPRWAS